MKSSNFINTENPIDINNLPKNTLKFSNFKKSKKVNYFELVNHRICWDYYLGIFLSVFRTNMWNQNKDIINLDKVSETEFYTNRYNTFPHLIIFAKAFKNSTAYIQSDPLSINLIGEREWADMYPFIESVRIPQVIDLYRENGLSFFRYLIEKNHACRRILPGVLKLFFFKSSKGHNLINFKKNILINLFYPSVYYYGIYYLFKKIFYIFIRN